MGKLDRIGWGRIGLGQKEFGWLHIYGRWVAYTGRLVHDMFGIRLIIAYGTWEWKYKILLIYVPLIILRFERTKSYIDVEVSGLFSCSK